MHIKSSSRDIPIGIVYPVTLVEASSMPDPSRRMFYTDEVDEERLSQEMTCFTSAESRLGGPCQALS